MSTKCIDVSSYNGIINWTKVKSTGVNNCIIKIIQKTLAADSKFESNYSNALSAGFQVGVYNYSYATSVTEAKTAAKAVIKNLQNKQIPSLGVWLDVEDNCQKNLGHILIDIINAYAYEIVNAGYKFGIYTGLSFYNSYLKSYANELQYSFWIARYPTSNTMKLSDSPSASKKPSLAGKTIWGWQYTSKGVIDGINGFVDISELYDEKIEASPVVATEVCYIGHASKDENGTYTNGVAGDQTGKEVCKRTWYNNNWTTVLRPKDAGIAEAIASAMEKACDNDSIGYSQSSRMTLNTQAQAVNYDLSKITIPCNCDCSSLVGVCCIAAGLSVPASINTSTEVSALMATGAFESLSNAVYTQSKNLLKRGDILHKQGHTAIVIGNSAVNFETNNPIPVTNNITVKLPQFKNPAAAGWYKTTANLRLRTGAGSAEQVICTMPKGSQVFTYGDYLIDNNIAWMGVAYGSVIGYCSIEYLKKI